MWNKKSPCWADNQGTDLIFSEFAIPSNQSLQDWNNKSESFSGTGHSFNDNVFVFHEKRNGRSLNGGHLGVSHGLNDIKAAVRYYLDSDFWSMIGCQTHIQGVSEIGSDDHEPAKAVELDIACIQTFGR